MAKRQATYYRCATVLEFHQLPYKNVYYRFKYNGKYALHSPGGILLSYVYICSTLVARSRDMT